MDAGGSAAPAPAAGADGWVTVQACGERSLQGHRPTQEDRVTYVRRLEPAEQPAAGQPAGGAGQGGGRRSLMAVFDGHGGHVCAEYCKRHMHNLVADQLADGLDDLQALRNGVLAVEAGFREAAAALNLASTSGSCVIAAVVHENRVTVANVGDSRAVLCRSGGRALALSDDHKPARPDERARIEAAGGSVGRTEARARGSGSLGVRFTEAACGCFLKMPMRVYPGGLAVSRSVGDVGVKVGELIVAEPEMRQAELFGDDEFLLLACDGVWDVMTRREAVGVVRAELARNGRDAEAAAAHLAQTAINKGSYDNVTAMVALLGREGGGGGGGGGGVGVDSSV